MVGAALAGNRSAAKRAAFGITSGVAVYVVAVAAGLGTLVARHAGALIGMQLVGAAYLVWLAYNAVQWSGDGSEMTAEADGQQWFRRGLVVNLTNPKIALFFIAFLAQFLGAATSPALQLLMLGVLLQVAGLVVDLLVGWAAGTFRDRVFQRPAVTRALRLTSAMVFAALAVLFIADVARRLGVSTGASQLPAPRSRRPALPPGIIGESTRIVDRHHWLLQGLA